MGGNGEKQKRKWSYCNRLVQGERYQSQDILLQAETNASGGTKKREYTRNNHCISLENKISLFY